MPHSHARLANQKSSIKSLLSPPGILAVLAALTALPAHAQDVVITGVIDGPITGGLPKAIEVCVRNDVPDMSIYGLGAANNGGGTDGEEFTFPAVAASAGTFLYVATESTEFTNFFGFAPDYTDGDAPSVNGDDAVELFTNGSVTDVFGDINVDGTGQPWEYQDGWAYRNNGTGPDGSTFTIGNWSFSGPNALDGETSNAGAATPFPIGNYSDCELNVSEPLPELLLSEIVVTPTAGEFIEIHNPTGAPIDLSDVYLTDATFGPGGTFYYNIVTGANAGGGGFGDFHARFPDGATIGAGEFQTISMTGSDDFFSEYGINPSYELFEDGVGADAIPDMREALAGSINNQGGLTNGGEVVILYYWDGESDLVQDIDYALWGDKDEAVDKTGVMIDGPDGDGTASSYLPDTAIASQDVIDFGGHAFGDSFQRIDFMEGVEVQAGGNGVDGSDETSEDLSNTWASDTPTPGAAPPPPGGLVINEIHADPDATLAGDANGDGGRDATEDEFVEIVNNGDGDLDISGWTLSDGFGVRHTFPANSVIVQGCSIVVFGGGSPTGSFGNSLVQTASSGSLGLNNGGDSVTLNNGVSDIVSASYGGEGGDDQSLTLDPDITGGSFVKHSVATGSGGALFSPGTKIDGSNFDGCPTAWVINEINADPDSTDGDANGDGSAHFSDDEFVEIVNNSGMDVDISGWTLADGFGVRHTFPGGSVVLSGCSVVVFGGGAPTGAFGNGLVQTASSGALGLNNGGDTVTLNNGGSDIAGASYGGEGGDNQSLTLDPDIAGPAYVKHSVATGSGGALYSPGTKIDGSQFDGCPVSAEIFEIQGDGLASPLVGSLVLTEDNIVTAVGTDGFFMQTPDARADADVNTSNGIFVFTGAAPTVAVGDQVDVFGNVVEFFDLTEFSAGAIVNVDSSGNAPPAAVTFDATTPSPDPTAPSCAIEYECYEGMLINIPAGVVTGPNQGFGTDPIAEVHVAAGTSRSYREPGIQFPGLPGLPVWDGNPEVFELDPDKLGLPNEIIPAGSTFSATGVLGYEFGGYELWPSSLSFTPVPLPVAVRSREVAEMTVGALNLFRLFDDVDNGGEFVVDTAEYVRRLAKFSDYIRNVMDAPDILAVSEVESLSVLQDLADTITADDAAISYTPYLEEGNDFGGIDVGFLVLDTVVVNDVTQLGKNVLHSYDNSLLNDRPPLLLEGRQVADGSDFPIAVIAIHGRSLNGIDTPGPGNGERVRQKRYEQAQFVAQQVQLLQDANPDINLVVAGDFNAFEFTDGYVDVTGHMKGAFTPADNLICDTNPCTDHVDPNLLNQVLMIEPGERYSFIFRGSAQVLDHALTSQGLDELVRDYQYARGNADAAEEWLENAATPLRSSDHDGLVLFLKKDSDGDGVTDDADYCPGTEIPEAAPTRSLRPNNYALADDDRDFDTVEPYGVGPMASYDIFDTAGCSCEQIVVEAGLGKGHLMFGCSIGEMEAWVEFIDSL